MESLEDRVVLNSTDLSIAVVAAPTTAVLGQPVTYTLTVTNNSPISTTSGVTVQDTVQPNLGAVTVTPSQGMVILNAGGTVMINLGNLIAGGSATVTVQGTVIDPGTLLNSATVSLGQGDTDPFLNNNSATISTAVSGSGGTTGPTGTTFAQTFVNQLYQDLLNRAADAGGSTFFISELATGAATPGQIVEAFLNSTEYRTLQIQTLYTQLLHRPVDPSGLSGWLTFLSQGGSLAQVEANLLASPEYFSARGGGTTSGFLQALYQDVLGRAPDITGLQGFTQALNGGASRLQLAEEVLASPEAVQLEVQRFYTQFLGRTADIGGLTGFSLALEVSLAASFNVPGAFTGPGLTTDQVIAALITSPEFTAHLTSSSV